MDSPKLTERIQAFLASNPLNEDGEPRDTNLLPGLSQDELANLEHDLGFQLPEPTRELLKFARGFEEGPMEVVDFVGAPANWFYLLRDKNRPYREIAPDGFGNSWFYDFDGSSSDLGPVFYYMHEGPMILFQSSNLTEFVEECLRFMTPPFQSLVDDVHEFRLKPIKNLHDDLISYQDALRADEHLAAFAATFDEETFFYDFRSSKPGDGFDLAKVHAVGRSDHHPIFALRNRKSLIQKVKRMFQPKK